MAFCVLQSLVEQIPDERIPREWWSFDFSSFSREKTLWDYQVKALQNALKALWKYYEYFQDYQPREDIASATRERKNKLWEWYKYGGLKEGEYAIRLDRKHNLPKLLQDYYPIDNNRLSWEHLINQMCFWMATGSGKTLVVVKLIEFLVRLMQRGEIPPHDILFLTHRDDLIEQLRRHVEEFNRSSRDLYITLRELREYTVVKRDTPRLFRNQEATVFFYRSDNLSDEQKEKIVDFRNYESEGRWYVFLDEAHKGDKEESKRQFIYSILSRNGFLFNFSATFTDPRDIATTVCNFNLEQFIQRGYGKHIVILKQEIRAFRDEEDYTFEEKQRVVLKALIMLAYVRKASEEIQKNGANLYHKPLLLVLANSVNVKEADLKLFFRELERIGKGEIAEGVFEKAKDELLQELEGEIEYIFEKGVRARIERDVLRNLSYGDLLRLVYNTEKSGEIEVFVRPSNKQEIAFKLKSGERPFALIKIGDISGWLQGELEGYEINESFQDESYFLELNEDDSPITILMGSRAFYEGWDSNRPNVLCYINIGMGEDAQKFILQSVGRGVRIEPLKNKRRRLLALYNAGDVDKGLFERLKAWAEPVETLFIFGTNRQAVQQVIEGLEERREFVPLTQLNLFEIHPDAKERRLLIPVYREGLPLAQKTQIRGIDVAKDEFEFLKKWIEQTEDRVLLAIYDTAPEVLKLLRSALSESGDSKLFNFNGRRFGHLQEFTRYVLRYVATKSKELDTLKELEDEIRHFRYITVTLQDVADLERKIKKVKERASLGFDEESLKRDFSKGHITLDEYTEGIKALSQPCEEKFEHQGQRIVIKHLVQHYYFPVIIGESEKVDYMQHIIKTESERQFIQKLEGYISQRDHGFSTFDWWLFSKIDESLDNVYIPYYDAYQGRMAEFKPDFIFWFQKGMDYFIVFVDPKGTEHRDPDRKIEGYRMLFEESKGTPKVIVHEGMRVRVLCFLWTKDVAKAPIAYRHYWVDSVETLAKRILESGEKV